jgi:hypothetical protein
MGSSASKLTNDPHGDAMKLRQKLDKANKKKTKNRGLMSSSNGKYSYHMKGNTENIEKRNHNSVEVKKDET